jgi:acyl carrier protein
MISKDEFLNQFYFIFDDLQGNSLSYNTIYKDLDEWDSLIVLSVIAHFDQKFGIIILPQSLFENNTFDELYNSIIDK